MYDLPNQPLSSNNITFFFCSFAGFPLQLPHSNVILSGICLEVKLIQQLEMLFISTTNRWGQMDNGRYIRVYIGFKVI